nr:synaptobrevin, longin-like domain protein [Tanacetum cinerariifolium]
MEERTKILTTVDGKLRTIFESSIRRNLKLNDEAGLSSLPDTELFENLTLMGYNISPNQKFTFQKGQFSHQWKYLIHTIMQCLSPKSTGFNEFSSNIATSLVCLATNRVYNFSKMIFDGMVKNVNNKVSKFFMYPRQYTRRARIAQSSAIPTAVDEPASPIGDGSQGEACPTELEITSLKARIKLLEDKDRRVTEQSGDDAPIKGRSLDEGEAAAAERSTERGSDDTEEMVNVLTSLDAAKILTSRGVQEMVNGMVLTASLIFTTATESTPSTRRKGKEKMVESDTPKKKKLQEQIDVQVAKELEEEIAKDAQRMNEQIARDAEIARIHAEEELQRMIDGLDRNNETVAKYLQEYYQFAAELPIGERIELISDLVKYQDNYGKVLKYQTQQKKPLSRKQQKEFYMSVLKSHAEESKRFNRKGLRLEHNSSKKLKTSEEVPKEKLKEMMELIPVEELWALVKETLNIRPAINDKEKELWVKLKRLDEFPLPEQLPTTNEDKFPLLIQSDATAKELYVAAKVKE